MDYSKFAMSLSGMSFRGSGSAYLSWRRIFLRRHKPFQLVAEQSYGRSLRVAMDAERPLDNRESGYCDLYYRIDPLR